MRTLDCRFNDRCRRAHCPPFFSSSLLIRPAQNSSGIFISEGVGSELAVSNQGSANDNTVIALRDSSQDTANQVGQKITRRDPSIQPTLTVRPGFRVNVMVNGAAAVSTALCAAGTDAMNMTRKLRLGPLPKTEILKLTFSCPATLKADLDRYAALHAQTYGKAVEVATLIPRMLGAFMDGDRGFRRNSEPAQG
jgi:hypothetical protein